MQPIAATRTALVCLSLGVMAAAAAGGQTVYRCGPNGNQYSALPCDDGRPVDVSDRRSAEQISETRQAVASQRKLALAMAREREQAERAKPPAQAGGIGPLPAVAPPKPVIKPKTKPASRNKSGKPGGKPENEHFVAVVPGSGKPASKKKTQP